MQFFSMILQMCEFGGKQTTAIITLTVYLTETSVEDFLTFLIKKRCRLRKQAKRREPRYVNT